MSFAAFITSPSVRDRLISKGSYRIQRHLLFWLVYAIYFYLQGISPDCVKGLNASEAFSYAFNSLCCFLPVCIGCVYATLFLLHPYFLEKKKYASFIAALFALFWLAVGINYFFSILFFKLSCHCDTTAIPFIRKFALGLLNSQNAITAAGLALGTGLALHWFYQKRENLRLARIQTKTRIGALKAKVHPDYMLVLLDGITQHLREGKPDSPAMILQLSDLLSYWLYDGEEEKLQLEQECAILRKFLWLEGARRGMPPIGQLTVEGNTHDAWLTPMILLPLVQAACATSENHRQENCPSFRQLQLLHDGQSLSFRLQMPLSAQLQRPVHSIQTSDLIHNARLRLQLYYPDRHSLSISEVKETIHPGHLTRHLHLSLDISYEPA